MIKSFNSYISESRKSLDALEMLNPEELGKLLLAEVMEDSPDVRYVKNLIDVGCPINAKDEFGCTPLHYAARYGDFEVVELLIKCGGDINAVDMFNRTALYWASKMGELEVVELLLSNGADIYIRNTNGNSTAWGMATDDVREKFPELNPNK